MKALKVSEIVGATKGTLISGEPNRIITDISTDSRKITEGCLFVPLCGEKFDGHDYIKAALDNGACAVLTERKAAEISSSEAAFIEVGNTLEALADIASYYRSLFDVLRVSITGSVGKTTTKEMCALVMGKRRRVHKNKGNFNNEIGVPLTLFGLDSEHEVLISEMGMSGFGEIDRISKMVNPNIVIMTNIGLSHIEFLGSQENIFKAKSEFVKNMAAGGTVIINGDDDILLSHINDLGGNVVTIGIKNKECDYVAKNIHTTDGGVEFTVYSVSESFDVKLPVQGEHNVYNALCACALGSICDVDSEAISTALSEFVPDSMRMCVTELEDFTIINDCYNAAPDSMVAALSVLSGYHGRRVAVLGDIACLGEYSLAAHENVGEEVYKRGIDLLITIGNEARHIANGAAMSGMEKSKIISFDSVRSALEKIKSVIEKNDTVLIKASRVMELERVTEFLMKS